MVALMSCRSLSCLQCDQDGLRGTGEVGQASRIMSPASRPVFLVAVGAHQQLGITGVIAVGRWHDVGQLLIFDDTLAFFGFGERQQGLPQRLPETLVHVWRDREAEKWQSLGGYRRV